MAVQVDSGTAVVQHAKKDNQRTACGRCSKGPAKAGMSPHWGRAFAGAVTAEVHAEEAARLLQRLARGAAVGAGIEREALGPGERIVQTEDGVAREDLVFRLVDHQDRPRDPLGGPGQEVRCVNLGGNEGSKLGRSNPGTLAFWGKAECSVSSQNRKDDVLREDLSTHTCLEECGLKLENSESNYLIGVRFYVCVQIARTLRVGLLRTATNRYRQRVCGFIEVEGEAEVPSALN